MLDDAKTAADYFGWRALSQLGALVWKSGRMGEIGRCATVQNVIGFAQHLCILLCLNPHRRFATGEWGDGERYDFPTVPA